MVHLLLCVRLLLNIPLVLLKKVLKIVALCLDADLSSDLDMVDFPPDLSRAQAQGKVGDCLLQLFHRGRGTPPELCLRPSPEVEVQGRHVRTAGGPGSVSLVTDHTIVKL